MTRYIIYENSYVFKKKKKYIKNCKNCTFVLTLSTQRLHFVETVNPDYLWKMD